MNQATKRKEKKINKNHFLKGGNGTPLRITIKKCFTFGRVKTQRIAVGPFTAAVEGFNTGIIKRIEMQAVHRADGFLATVNLLGEHMA